MSLAPRALPRLLAGLQDDSGGVTLPVHERIHGPRPSLTASELIQAVELSGLRGRGGADFPTARKLRAVAGRRGRIALIVNGNETEPASAKDSLLLTSLPHLVLDGAVLAARAIGARDVIVQVPGNSPQATASVSGAIAVRSDDRVSIELVAGAGRYVAGEESAVVRYLNGGPPKPTYVPPRPYERGYRGRPTLVHNPETLAQIALIARHGANWFRQLGTHADPGSVLVTITGAVAAPGVYELAFGTSIGDLLAAAGGPVEPLQALLIGGYFGSWVSSQDADGLRLTRAELTGAGASLGAGVLVALGESCCGLHESARITRYLADESAGQCGPCVHGLAAIADGVGGLAQGVAHPSERERVLRWAEEVRGRGACHHPDGAARFVQSALRVFAADLVSHQRQHCSARSANLPLGPQADGAAVQALR